jgi:lysophospholipase L1-like esterase
MEVRMQPIQIRSQLVHTKHALTHQQLTIGFLGGSITENRVPHNWPEAIIRFFLLENPGLQLSIENAAIGATGSDFGLMRVDQDIIAKQPHLVFIEYAVNDWWTPSQKRIEQMEGIIRRLKRYGQCDIVLIYTYLQDMYADLEKDITPLIVTEYENLANHYHLNTVYSGYYAIQRVKQGLLRFEEWLPDGLHPQFLGSEVYADPIKEMIKKALIYPIVNQSSLPKPLEANHWEHARLIPLSSIQLSNTFYLKRSSTQAFVDDVIFSSAVGATIKIPFSGRGLVLVFDFGKRSSEFRYSIDNDVVEVSKRDRPSWCGNSGWLRPFVIGGNLDLKPHQLTLEIIHGNRPDCEGTLFELTHILELL